MTTKQELERQVRALRKALLSLIYQNDAGRWRVVVKEDWDVTDEVSEAINASAST